MSPDRALTRHLAARAARSTAVWGLAYATVVLSSAAAYATAYPTAVQRRALAVSLAHDRGVVALFGPVHGLDSVDGFTAWRTLGLLTIVGAVWGVLTGSRLMRGDEDAGRWEVLLAGATDRRRAARAGVTAAALLVVLLWSVTLAGALVAAATTGLTAGAVLPVATAAVAPSAVFLAVGLVCGQLLPTRRSAALAGGALLAAAYLGRVAAVATGHPGASWSTPVGWTDRLHTAGWSPAAGALVLALVLTCAAITPAIAAARDLGGAPLAVRGRSGASRRLLGGPGALAVRQVAPALLGWGVALAAVCTVLAAVAPAVARADRTAGLGDLLDRFGAPGGGAAAFLGVAMLSVGSAVSLAAAAAGAAIRETEAEGRVDLLLVTPVSRSRWFVLRVGAAAAAVTACGLVVGGALATAGAVSAPEIATGRLLGAGLNTVPAALVVLGVATLAYGIAPRLTAPVAFGLVAWSFLVELVGATLRAPWWVLDLSLLHHLALAPAVPVDGTTDAVLVAVALVAATAGGVAFTRRDLLGA